MVHNHYMGVNLPANKEITSANLLMCDTLTWAW